MFRRHRNNGATFWVPDAPDTTGLEVIEDDPESSWNLWQSAVAEQESRGQPKLQSKTMPQSLPKSDSSKAGS